MSNKRMSKGKVQPGVTFRQHLFLTCILLISGSGINYQRVICLIWQDLLFNFHEFTNPVITKIWHSLKGTCLLEVLFLIIGLSSAGVDRISKYRKNTGNIRDSIFITFITFFLLLLNPFLLCPSSYFFLFSVISLYY
jgi:hypothetical protein